MQVFSKAEFVDTDVLRIHEEIQLNRRVLLKIKVDIFNSEIEIILEGIYESDCI